ncbi:hypothetical protein SteCoe_1468 [Stentor coeruleus]|uniref:Uncharacterized protein n=1 Tax=Stentor coeruleus TaxID=5963 RepID=A0A1R2D1Y2_9CILI|nr:hypothetical protein SteCoe_1468 [Stentor coeruleus]
MQENDSELNSILREARENYQKRIEDLKSSLNSISIMSQNKNLHNNLEKHMLTKANSRSPEGLKNSVRFHPNILPSSNEVPKSTRLRPSNSEDSGLKSKMLALKLEQEYINNSQLLEELRNMNHKIMSLEENLERWKKSYQEAEENNISLRSRLKDATMQINKLTSEISRIKDKNKAINIKDFENLKMRYKQKMTFVKEKMVGQANERQALVNEISLLKKRENDFKRVCETQISEICEEYTSKIKTLKSQHNEAITKLKMEYETRAETENSKYIEDINSLNTCLSDSEANLFQYKKKLEDYEKYMNLSKEKIEEYEFLVQSGNDKLNTLLQIKDSLDQALREKDLLINGLHSTLQKERLDYETKIKNITNDAKSLKINHSKIIEEYEMQNSTYKKTQSDLENKLESERKKTINLENKSACLEEAYSDLKHNYDNVLYKCQILESQITQQSNDYQKQIDKEMSIYNDHIQGLENELKSFYAVNNAQAKELDELKKLFVEIEAKQDEDMKAVKQNHDENIREIKNIDRCEYMQLTGVLENTKIQLEECENQLGGYRKKDFEYEKVVKALDNELRENAEMKAWIGKWRKNMGVIRKNKDDLNLQVRKVRETVECIKTCVKEGFEDYKNYQYKCLLSFGKTFMKHIESIKRSQSLHMHQYSQENSKISYELEKAYEKISTLEKSLQSPRFNSKNIEENSTLLQTPEHQDIQKPNNFYITSLYQIISQISFLEGSIEESYNSLYQQVQETKISIQQDKETLEKDNKDTAEQAKKSIEYYRDQFQKLENEKNLESHISQQELFTLEQRLSEVLDCIRNERLSF